MHVLVIISIIGQQGAVITFQDFSSKQACMSANVKILSEMANTNPMAISSFSGFCVEK